MTVCAFQADLYTCIQGKCKSVAAEAICNNSWLQQAKVLGSEHEYKDIRTAVGWQWMHHAPQLWLYQLTLAKGILTATTSRPPQQQSQPVGRLCRLASHVPISQSSVLTLYIGDTLSLPMRLWPLTHQFMPLQCNVVC